MNEDEIVSVVLAAEAVGVKPATIRSWIHRGLLPVARRTRCCVFVRYGDVWQVDQSLDQRKRGRLSWLSCTGA